MFKQSKSFPFPRITGYLDDDSEDLNAVRNYISTKVAVRFVEDPRVLIKHPLVKGQITIGFIQPENMLLWETFKDQGGMLNLLVVSGDCQPSKGIGRTAIHDTTIRESSKIMTSDDILIRIAYLISITHLYVPETRRISNRFVEVCDSSIFRKTIWITNLFKNKQYEDRKQILSNLRKMIDLPEETRPFDEMVIFGTEEYLQKINTEKSYVKKIHTHTNTGVIPLGEIVRWTFKQYPKDTIAMIVRQESTQLSFSTIRSVTRMNTRTIACLNPFVLPDIPDPKPELYQRGDPRTICGYVIKLDEDTTFSDSSNLDQCSLYSVNHHEIMMGEMMMQRYVVGNGSRQIVICFPNLNSFVLEKTSVNPTMGVICPEKPTLSFYQSTLERPGKSIFSYTCEGFDFDTFPGIHGEHPLETRTMLNMTNKSARRKKGNDLYFLNEEPKSYPSQSYELFSGHYLRFRRESWSDNKQMVSQDYWGNGVSVRDTGFIHGSEILSNCTIIPRTSDTIIDRVCMILALEGTPYEKSMIVDINPEEASFFQKLAPNLQYRNFKKSNMFGGESCVFVRSPNVSKELGFSPVIVRSVNRKYHEKANVDIEMMRMLGETNGLIVMSKWAKGVNEIACELYPNIKWKIVESVNPEEFANASYVIGMQEASTWVGSMFVHPDHCKIVEIAYEHDTKSHWYHLSRGIGVHYSVIPLKNEPKKRCFQRIRNHLKHYLGEE